MQSGSLSQTNWGSRQSCRDDSPADDLLVKLIGNEINLAHIFVAAALRAYDLDYLDDGNAAYQKAADLYKRAATLARELPPSRRSPVCSGLRNLFHQIERLREFQADVARRSIEI